VDVVAAAAMVQPDKLIARGNTRHYDDCVWLRCEKAVLFQWCKPTRQP
jgi:hypothetical protein